MKKIISIVVAALLIATAAVTCFAADLPEADPGYTIFKGDDFSYLSLINVDDGSEFEDEEWYENGHLYGTNGGVQVWVDQGHLASHHSWAITPDYQVVVKFSGTDFHLGANFRDTASAGIVVEVDGQVREGCVFDDVSAAFDGTHTIPTRIVKVEGLEDGEHEIIIYPTTAVRLSFDWYEIKFSGAGEESSQPETEPNQPDTSKAGEDTNKPADSQKTSEGTYDKTTGEEKSNVGLIIAIVAAVVVVLAIVCALVAKKKK
ncbi:MAG: hypothetical protein IKY07_00825 [Clostridia bacterium]|nr:hypothetical protein [Clostridia bacterium]